MITTFISRCYADVEIVNFAFGRALGQRLLQLAKIVET